VARLCDGIALQRNRAAVRLTLIDSTSAPVAGAPVWLSWVSWHGNSAATMMGARNAIESMTNNEGIVTFCDVPNDLPLDLAFIRPSGQGGRAIRLTKLGETHITARTVVVPRPR